jgi:hypothetical protein
MIHSATAPHHSLTALDDVSKRYENKNTQSVPKNQQQQEERRKKIMNNKVLTIVTPLGLIVLLAVFLVGGLFSYRTGCIRTENKLDAQYEQDKNSYDNMWKKFREIAQVKDEYAKDLKEIWNSAMLGRYGDGGSRAIFQFVKEQNPTLDPSIYTRLQSAIEAGRNSFNAEQQQLLDMKNTYKNLLGSTSGLLYNWLLGFPRCDLSKYGIVTSDTTDEAFKNKKAFEIGIFGKNF